MLSSDIPGLLNSRGLIFDVLLATAIGGDTVSILYKRRELIQKIDSILNSVPIQYETNPLMRNELSRLPNELNPGKKEFEPLQLGGKRSTRKAKKSMRKTRKHR